MSRETEYFPFVGGINTETPALVLKPGELIDGFNYEPIVEGGYRRIGGLERMDGQPLPSEASYHIVNFESGEHEPNVGETMVGGTSFAQAKVLAIVLESGAWGTSDAAGYFVLEVLSGTLINGENLSIYHSVAFTTGFNSAFV